MPHETVPSIREVGDRARLAEEVVASLERVRSTAENWRTGMAGLVTLVTATLLFKGRGAIGDYGDWVKYTLGALTTLALALGVVSLWLFLAAAHGRLRPVSTQSIIDSGGVDIRNVHLATTALGDLRWARRLAVSSAVLVAAALVLSWYGPAAPNPASGLVKVVAKGARAGQPTVTACGKLTAQDASTTVLQVGSQGLQRFPTSSLVSLTVVTSC